MPRRTVRVVVALFAALAIAPAAAGAATINVEIQADHADTEDGQCALREAVRSANENDSVGGCDAGEDGVDTIRVPAGEYLLTIDGEDNGSDLGDLDVSGDTRIIGQGKGAVIDAGGDEGIGDRVLDLRIGDVTLRNLTIENGRSDDDGAGIRTAGDTTTLARVKVLNNDAGGPGVAGGGIYAGGVLEITDSVISGNNAPFMGGIDATDGLAMFRTTVRNNDAAFAAGGVHSQDASLIFESVFIGNELTSETGTHQGGALALTANTNIRNTTFFDNRAAQGGGAIAAFSSAQVNLTNVTVTGNVAEANGELDNPADGGGLYSEGGGVFRIRNTVVAGNSDLTPLSMGDIEPDCSAEVLLHGNNLIGDEEGCSTLKALGTPNELPEGTNPLFGEIGLYGGPTQTIPLRGASPLRNRINKPACDDQGISKDPEIRIDQRGVPRPQQGKCDVGAYEYAVCAKKVVTRIGTGGVDVLRGGQTKDGILGLGGRDKLQGRSGGDGLCGGGAGDRLAGGPSRDTLVGGRGRDRLNGGPGRDVCKGGPGKDVAIGCEKEIGI